MSGVAFLLIIIAVLATGAASIPAQGQDTVRTDANDLVAAHEKITQYMLQQDAAAPQNAPERVLKNTGTLLIEPQDATTPQNAPRGSPPDRSSDPTGLPVFMTFANRTSGELVVGLDQNATGTAKQYTAQIRQIVNSTVPIRLVSGYFVPQSCNAVDDRCDPLVGGIQISSAPLNNYIDVGAITLPAVSNDNEIGFVMSGHTADPNRINTSIYQPEWRSLVAVEVGSVITNPHGPRSSDSAFVDTDNRIALEQKIFNPGDPANPYNVVGTKTSAQTAIFDVVHMAGVINKTIAGQNYTTTGGGVLTKDVTLRNHADYGVLSNQIVASYISAFGDSGAPVYSINSDNDVFFHGVHVGLMCFADFPPTVPCLVGAVGNSFAIYSPWEHVMSELNLRPVTGSLELNAVLDEGFESGLSNWTGSGVTGWGAKLPSGPQVPDHADTNRVAHADGCVGDCVLRSNAVDVSGYASPQLSFWRLVDASIDPGEYLRVEVSGDGGSRWTEVYRWTDGAGDDGAWHRETVSLDPYKSERFKVRFVAKAGGSSEAAEVDDVLVSESGICTPSSSGDWHIRDDCTLGSDMEIPAGITIHPPAVLTIPAGVTLDVDLAGHGLLIRDGAGLLIQRGGGMR